MQPPQAMVTLSRHPATSTAAVAAPQCAALAWHLAQDSSSVWDLKWRKAAAACTHGTSTRDERGCASPTARAVLASSAQQEVGGAPTLSTPARFCAQAFPQPPTRPSASCAAPGIGSNRPSSQPGASNSCHLHHRRRRRTGASDKRLATPGTLPPRTWRRGSNLHATLLPSSSLKHVLSYVQRAMASIHEVLESLPQHFSSLAPTSAAAEQAAAVSQLLQVCVHSHVQPWQNPRGRADDRLERWATVSCDILLFERLLSLTLCLRVRPFSQGAGDCSAWPSGAGRSRRACASAAQC